jgi:SAM-dependent methyltransferase
MDDAILREEWNLKQSWDCLPSEYLDRYLVSGVEDPRINTQSILTRALLIDTLYPGRFDAPIAEELRFGAVLTWVLREMEKGSTPCKLLDAVESAGTGDIPEFIRAAHAWLQDDACPIPDYLTATLGHFDPDQPRPCLPEPALDTFMVIWSQQLPQTSGPSISVLEAACGSANDYRFLCQCGVARALRYTGIDIAARNIANARSRYPQADFRLQSILATDLPDGSFDCLFCHDLIEHLSFAAMERALGEMFRIARSDVILHLFNGKWSGAHEVVPVDSYYRNRLSMEKIVAFLERLGGHVTCLEMTQWLREKVGAPGYHNPNAFSILVEKQVGLAK